MIALPRLVTYVCNARELTLMSADVCMKTEVDKLLLEVPTSISCLNARAANDHGTSERKIPIR